MEKKRYFIVAFVVAISVMLVSAMLLLHSSIASPDSPERLSLLAPEASFASHYAIKPDEMNLIGDVVVCGSAITDAIVSSWCTGAPTGTIILGVDPSSHDPADWDGGLATATLYISDVASSQVAVIAISWPDRDGKGIHSPDEGQVATITWDGVPVWTKRTRDVSTFGDYYAAQHDDIIATAVMTQPATHTLTFQSPASTAWDISTITIKLYPLPNSLRGIAYSPFRDCQNPDWGPLPSESEVREDLARLAHTSNGIRTYSALTMTGWLTPVPSIMGHIPRIAQEYGLPVCAGAWLGREKDGNGEPISNANHSEIKALIHIAQTVPLDCVIVGNEVLLRGDLSATELISYINEVKAAVNVPVTTAEVGDVLRKPEYANVLDALDLIMIHTYPYWNNQPITDAVDWVVQDYLKWRENYPDKRIVIGETGWPSEGPARGLAVPSLENQQRFFYDFLAAAAQHHIEFYYFDAFDELWKREGGVGSHWGYVYTDRTGKHEVQSVLVPAQYPIYLPLTLKNGSQSSVANQLYPNQPSWPEYPAVQSLQQMFEGEFVVFDEYHAEENHFAPSGWMGDVQDLSLYECDDHVRPNSGGQVSVRITYAAQGSKGWAGIYWQEPDGNWGVRKDAGYNLDNATSLHFWARGDKGGEQITFLMGGIWGQYPDSQQPALSTDVITLTTEWTEYTLDLRGRDLSRVIGGFGFVTDRCLNPEPITFYLDNIYYVLSGDPGLPSPTPTPTTPYAFNVYSDKDVVDNHYAPSGWMGDTGDIILSECWLTNTHSGRTAIRVEYTAKRQGPYEGCEGTTPCNWAGVYWQHPAENWGNRPGGYDLTDARALTFWAKGEKGGERISFGLGGVGCESGVYPDSLCPVRILDPAPTVLTTTWQAYTIPLSADLNLRHLVGGFLWTASASGNRNGATFYLDDIQYLFNTDIVSTFFSSPGIPIGSNYQRTFSLDFGDADRDGDLDLVVVNHGQSQVCWNKGNALFDCTTNLAGGVRFDAHWGDLDGDGYLDLVVTGSHPRRIAEQHNLVCFNKEQDHTFACSILSGCPEADTFCGAALGDVDQDNDLDIAISNRFGLNLIYYNDGYGSFPVTATICTNAGWTWDLDFGDVDNDSDLDLIGVGDSQDYVCINNGTGHFTETRWLAWRQDGTRSVALGDMDNDGDLDAVVGESDDYPIEVYLNNGQGYFSTTLLVGLASDYTYDIVVGDVDEDGDLDIVARNQGQQTALYFNDPITTTHDVTFTRRTLLGAGSLYGQALALGDVDNDCDLDLAEGYDGGQNMIYLNPTLGGCAYLPIIFKDHAFP